MINPRSLSSSYEKTLNGGGFCRVFEERGGGEEQRVGFLKRGQREEGEGGKKVIFEISGKSASD